MNEERGETPLRTIRRFYLAKRHAAHELCDLALEALWRGKQEAEPGAALPVTFPMRGELAALGYTAVEDLDGADVEELARLGLSRKDAAAVMAALSKLVGAP
ncbi:MAG: hypothetical protein DIU78_009830 [Pseudomonadota bacterium]